MIVKGDKILPKLSGPILLIQLGDIGDVVLTMPAIRALHENFPKHRLIVCVHEKARELIEDCPWADDIISVNKKKRSLRDIFLYQKDFFRNLRGEKISWAIDLRHGTRGAAIAFLSGAYYRLGRYAGDGWLWRNRLFTHLVAPENEIEQYSAEHNFNIIEHMGLRIGNRRPELIVSPERRASANTILKRTGIQTADSLIAFHPFSLWKYKELGVNLCVELVDYLSEKYRFPVIITGSQEERSRAGEVIEKSRGRVFNLAGKTSIGELCGILQTCRMFIGVDTAALHIASAVGTPTIGIFGPSSPVSWAPRGENHLVVQKNMPCVPCRQKGCHNSETSLCLNRLRLEDLKENVEKMIHKLSLIGPGLH